MKNIDPQNPNHILIGLGGTGGKVLKAFRKRLWEEFPTLSDREKLALGFVYVDSTDEMMNPDDPSWRVFGQNAQFTTEEFVNIKAIDLGEILDHPDNYPGLRHVISNPNMMRQTLGEVGKAAGQKRRAGRILFGANIGKYMAAVKGQWEKVKSVSKNSNNCHIHIFAGLAGGTGSGSVVDAVAQLRSEATFNGENKIITVYAMVPELDIPRGCQAGRYHQNGFAALSELSALNCSAYLPCDVRTGDEHIHINTIPKKQFGLMVYSNVNENGAVVDSFTELPKLLSDMVYFTIFTGTINGVTDNYKRGFSNENKPDFLVENSYKSKNNDLIRARTKAVNSFGIKRIVYPEQRIVEHISYTFANSAFSQMAYNNYKEDFGYVAEPQKKDYNQLYVRDDGQMRKWMLTDDFLTLNERILETDKKFEQISEYWKNQAEFNSYDDAKSADANPLHYIEQFCKDKYDRDFRVKQGVESYYQDKSNQEVLNAQASTIVEAIERDLYSQWYDGKLSLVDLMSVSDVILTYLKKRREKIENDIHECDEKINGFQQEMDDNMYDYDHLNLMEKAIGKPKSYYTDHQDIVADFYTMKTYRVAYVFAGRLLGRLQAAFEEFHDSVQSFVGAVSKCMDEATHRISDRNQKQGDIKDMKSAIIEVREDAKVASFEKSILMNKNTMETLAGNLRRKLVKEQTYAKFDKLLPLLKVDKAFDVVDEVLGTKVREIQSQQTSTKERLIGINVLQQLQKVLPNDDEINRFAKNAVDRSGVFILLDHTELTKATNNNPNPITKSESVNIKNVLITLPTSEGDDELKDFAEKLKRAFSSQFTKESDHWTIDFNTSVDTKNEITIAAVKSLFPVRAISWMKTYEKEYKSLTEDSNVATAREAKIILHSEGDGSQLPPIMGERTLAASEFGPYFFLAAATGIIVETDDERHGHGWSISEIDDNCVAIPTFLGAQFTELINSPALTPERRSLIEGMVNEKVADTSLTINQRNEISEKIKSLMRDVVLKECSSPTSPKYEKNAKDARQAREMISINN